VDLLGRTAAVWATDSGQYGFKGFFSQDKQCFAASQLGTEGQSSFPSAAWEKTCTTMVGFLVFWRGFSENSFASLINRTRARRRARARMA